MQNSYCFILIIYRIIEYCIIGETHKVNICPGSLFTFYLKSILNLSTETRMFSRVFSKFKDINYLAYIVIKKAIYLVKSNIISTHSISYLYICFSAYIRFLQIKFY